MSVSLRDYERSTHDLSRAWRSPIGVGTLVPFMKELVLPGDGYDIELEHKVLTHPTTGPLFGNYKIQMDLFTCPIRLYNAQLHNNALGIGLSMKTVKMPVAEIGFTPIEDDYFPTIHRNSVYNYLGLKDVKAGEYYNIVPELMYIDTFKNYYANKQENKFYLVGRGDIYVKVQGYGSLLNITLLEGEPNKCEIEGTFGYEAKTDLQNWNENPEITIVGTNGEGTFRFRPNAQSTVRWTYGTGPNGIHLKYLTAPKNRYATYITGIKEGQYIIQQNQVGSVKVGEGDKPLAYNLEDCDKIREYILSKGKQQIRLDGTNKSGIELLDDYLGISDKPIKLPSFSGGGLILKTHMSDINNNWVNSEWIDGENGISAITKVDTSGGSFTIDTLNLAQKVYNMLNRIAISGGTYKDWIETVYTTDYYFRAETPVYEGGASATIDFSEVVSQSATANEPLGTLAGRGFESEKRGGQVRISVNEPSYILGLVSITPYVDYSQGNDWDLYLDNLDELHKPQLDGIGYQDRLMRNMDARVHNTKAIGKQPAWINYMTAVNETHGNFAAGGNESFMVLNRVYEVEGENENREINNATTYINPKDYTYIFAENNIDNADFWVQIGMKITARRVMSAKQIPMM
nr:major capsid protein [Rattus norvegicus microvirus]